MGLKLTRMLQRLEHVNEFTNKSSGNLDKAVKTLGYLCNILGIYKNPEYLKLGSAISMGRYIYRFNGGLDALLAACNVKEKWCLPSDNKYIQHLVQAQAYTMLLYYPLEHIAWIGYIAPKLFPIHADKYSRHSCVLWSIYIVLDLYIYYLRYKTLSAKRYGIRGSLIYFCNRYAKLSMIRNLLYLPTAIHWSVEKPILSSRVLFLFVLVNLVLDKTVQWLGLSEGILGLYQGLML